MGGEVPIIAYTAGLGSHFERDVRPAALASPACSPALATSAFVPRRRPLNPTVVGLSGDMVSGFSRFRQGSRHIQTKLECSLESRTGTLRLSKPTRIVTKGNAGVNALQPPSVAAISIAGVPDNGNLASSASSTVVGRPIVLADCGETCLNDFRNLQRL
jgi:hypothetical protein